MELDGFDVPQGLVIVCWSEADAGIPFGRRPKVDPWYCQRASPSPTKSPAILAHRSSTFRGTYEATRKLSSMTVYATPSPLRSSLPPAHRAETVPPLPRDTGHGSNEPFSLKPPAHALANISGHLSPASLANRPPKSGTSLALHLFTLWASLRALARLASSSFSSTALRFTFCDDQAACVGAVRLFSMRKYLRLAVSGRLSAVFRRRLFKRQN